jgi:hypothetical protein
MPMSQGRNTQQLLNLSMIVTCVLAFTGIALMATFQHPISARRSC